MRIWKPKTEFEKKLAAKWPTLGQLAAALDVTRPTLRKMLDEPQRFLKFTDCLTEQLGIDANELFQLIKS